MKQVATMLFLLVFLTLCHGQTKNIDCSKTIKEQAEMMGQLLLKKDFISYSKYTYPKIIDMMGGKQKMETNLA